MPLPIIAGTHAFSPSSAAPVIITFRKDDILKQPQPEPALVATNVKAEKVMDTSRTAWDVAMAIERCGDAQYC